ncbi:MAG: hypothetical protein V1914_00965 [archaeon]
MRNKAVGIIIVGIAVLMSFIIYSFNKALTDIVNTACSHGPECPMWGTITFQTRIGIGIMVFVVLIGLYLIFFDKGKLVRPQLRLDDTKEKEHKTPDLRGDEKLIFDKVRESDGTMFQSDLVEKTGLTKVKVTRILDRLEGKKIIERRRRGMTNVIILK